MPRRAWIAALSFWPGLAQIWTGQEILGLILAVLFASTLNIAVVSHFVWTEALARGWPAFFGALAATTWVGTLVYTLWWSWRCHPERHREEVDRLYREALEFYLQGKWDDARRQIEQVLTLDETDADALMQLGTLYLRMGQPGLARRTFRQCLEMDGGSKWRWEIERALSAIAAG